MEHQDARSLIPSYLDGELSQAQAGPLRQHLLDCQPCRASAQDLKNQKRWFVPTSAVAVPQGFAARVARRAIQGDTGESFEPAGIDPERAEAQGRLLRFVLVCTAAAAAALLTLSIGVRNLSLPQTGRLIADDKAELRLDQALEDLDRINRTDKIEAPKIEAPKIEAPKIEAPKLVAPKPAPTTPEAPASSKETGKR